MKLNKKPMGYWAMLIVMIGSSIFLTAVPALAGTGLPSRNPPAPEKEQGNGGGSPAGSTLELVGPAHPGAWSVVQWQDINGDWQDVEGWRGSLDSSGQRRWWVAAKDFGSGPFRWVVGDSVSPTAVSQAFNLPETGAVTLRVPISTK